MGMDSDDSLSDLSEFSDFNDLTDFTERLWDSNDEEYADCDAEIPPGVQEGRRLWRHAEDRHGKTANRHRRHVGMAVVAVA